MSNEISILALALNSSHKHVLYVIDACAKSHLKSTHERLYALIWYEVSSNQALIIA